MITYSNEPKGFRFFTALCLFLGAFGFLGNAVFLTFGIVHELSPDAGKVASAVWLPALHLFRDAGYIFGGVKVKRRVEWARRLILFCAATSLLELFFNTATSLSKGQLSLSSATLLYFLLPVVLEGGVLLYFSQKPVRDFIREPSDFQATIE